MLSAGPLWRTLGPPCATESSTTSDILDGPFICDLVAAAATTSPNAPYSNRSCLCGGEGEYIDLKSEAMGVVLADAATSRAKVFCNSSIRASRLVLPDVDS